MRRTMLRHHVLTAFCAVFATILLIQSGGRSSASGSPCLPSGPGPADLSSEGRTLETYVDDLVRFDKKRAELGRKPSLTKAEIDSLDQTSIDLKRRLSGIQNALSQIVTKLKAAGQFEDIDQTLLGRVRDPVFQGLVNRAGFKKTLENAALHLADTADEISKPLDVLRNKVKAQAGDSIFEQGNTALALRAVRVGFATPPLAADQNLRCRLVSIHYGIHGFIHTESTTKLNYQINCFCLGDQGSCDHL